eukprot:scaffold79205_cov15-Prasinocladus_malaysianus.AAC.1
MEQITLVLRAAHPRLFAAILQEPDYDFTKVIDEWKPAVKQELDMRQEAEALKVPTHCGRWFTI